LTLHKLDSLLYIFLEKAGTMGGTASKQEFRTAVLDLVNSKQVEILKCKL
jgi:hypothetical protein